MKNSLPTPERMLITWCMLIVISQSNKKESMVCFTLLPDMNFFFVFQQEYVFDAEDGHTEIMPVREKRNLLHVTETNHCVQHLSLYCIALMFFVIFTQIWTPPTPPQDDNDIYIDSVMCLMYDTTPMPESKLPPIYIRKEHKRLKMDPSGEDLSLRPSLTPVSVLH